MKFLFFFIILNYFKNIKTELSGKEAYEKGLLLVQLGKEKEASEAFWIAILKSSSSSSTSNSISSSSSTQISSSSSSSSTSSSSSSSSSSIITNKDEYDSKMAFEQFMGTYQRRKIPEYGLLKIGKQFKLQGLEKEAIEYLQTVVKINSKLIEPYLLLGSMQSIEPNIRLKYMINALMIDPDGYHVYLILFYLLFVVFYFNNIIYLDKF